MWVLFIWLKRHSWVLCFSEELNVTLCCCFALCLCFAWPVQVHGLDPDTWKKVDVVYIDIADRSQVEPKVRISFLSVWIKRRSYYLLFWNLKYTEYKFKFNQEESTQLALNLFWLKIHMSKYTNHHGTADIYRSSVDWGKLPEITEVILLNTVQLVAVHLIPPLAFHIL